MTAVARNQQKALSSKRQHLTLDIGRTRYTGKLTIYTGARASDFFNPESGTIALCAPEAKKTETEDHENRSKAKRWN